MAPKKQPPSMFSLSMKATVDLFRSSIVIIAKKPTNHSAYQKGIEMLRRLVDMLPHRILHSLLEALQKLNAVSSAVSSAVMYSVFMQENLRKLVINNSIRYFLDYSKLKNLVDLHLSNISQGLMASSAVVFNDDSTVIITVGKVCKKLESIHFSSRFIPQCLRSLALCIELRKITYNMILKDTKTDVMIASEHTAATLAVQFFPKLEYYSYDKMGEVVESCDLPLALRYVKQVDVSGQHIAHIIAKCPRVQHLEFTLTNASHCCQVYRLMCQSSLDILEFRTVATSCSDCLIHYLRCKGGNLERLTVTGAHVDLVMSTVAKYCTRLTYLKVDYLNFLPREQSPHDNDLNVTQSALTNLQELDFSTELSMDLQLLMTIIPRKSTLTVLKLNFRRPKMSVMVDVVGLLDWADLQCLQRLDISADCMITEHILRSFYERQPMLTSLNFMAPIDDAGVCYLITLRQAVHDKHLDLVIRGSFVLEEIHLVTY